MKTLVLLFLLAVGTVHAEKVGCYISSGDNDWLWTSPPVNSKSSVEALFETLKKVYGVQRIYWRGSHAEWALDNMVARPENFLGHAFWQWERYLVKEAGQTDWAIHAARARGMSIWGMNPLFDHGAQAASDSAKLGDPSPVELLLRVEHPEYVPIDRFGLRRQSGPLELAYPQVRKTLIAQYLGLLRRRNYDGLMFYTYVEHCSLRFDGEFGFNEPVVKEFKRRYGQDIRKEPFDRHAWSRLRGEYVTRYLRELGKALHRRGKKLGIAIDPQNTHLPAPWLGMDRQVHPAGRIYMDWERWVREGIVDELMVYCNGSLEKALNDALAVVNGTRCVVSTIHSTSFPAQQRHFTEAGVRRVMVGAYDYFEWGRKEPQPASALASSDFLRRLRVLRQVEEKKLELPAERLISATRDPNVLVRRQAIRTLATLEIKEAAPVVEALLNDPETGVRCVAASALVKLHRSGSVEKLFQAMRHRSSFQFQNAVASCLANLPDERTEEILKGCAGPNVTVRQVTVYALSRGLRRTNAVPSLVRSMDDTSPYVRFYAAGALERFVRQTKVTDCLLAHLQDPHPSVRNRVALALRTGFQSKSYWIGARQYQALKALSRAFARMGEAGAQPDAYWSFRPVGNALLAMGPRGKAELERFMNQRKNKQLADFAWRILYVLQNGWRYQTATETEAEAGYRQHPILSGWTKPAPRNSAPEPERMPYLQQDFDSLSPYSRGKVGDYMEEHGQWRGLGDVAPAPLIQAQVRRGTSGNALRLTRGPAGFPHGLEGLRADYRLTRENSVIEFWVFRNSARSSFACTWKDSGSGHWYIGAYIAPSGGISAANGDRAWTRTSAVLPHGKWQRLRFVIDGAKYRYSLYAGGKELTCVKKDISFPGGQQFNILTFSPQAPEGNTFYVDDVSVTVPNPAHE